MNYIDELVDFITNSPTSFHAIDNIKKLLSKNGYKELKKNKFTLNSKYFVVRDNSSIIAVNIPNDLGESMKMVSSHSDSPYYKLKINPTIKKYGYTLLNIAPYGGMIHSSFVDIPLSISGIVYYINNGVKCSKLISFNRPMAIISNLAIHLNRDINSGYSYKMDKELLPMLGKGDIDLLKIIKEEFDIKGKIISHDLYVHSYIKPYIWGSNNEFLSSPRLDNLESAFCSTKAFIETDSKNISLLCIFDNEEVGSLSYKGASSNFLDYVLDILVEDLNISKRKLYSMIENSYVISADNAHSLHPNYPEKYDLNNVPNINEGVVIKFSNNQSYTTNGDTSSEFISLCIKNDVPYQVYENHSSLRGGSTLGNLINFHTSFKSVDIGLAQFAMHSALETSGTIDINNMIKILKGYYK